MVPQALTSLSPRTLASIPFTFIVGPQEKEFYIHREMVAQLSPVLDDLVKGPMREALEGVVAWPDVTVDTFLRFASFIYTEGYEEPRPVPGPVDSNGKKIYENISRSSTEPRIADCEEFPEILAHVPTNLPYSVSSYLKAKERRDGLSIFGDERPQQTTQTTAKCRAMMAFRAISFSIDSDPKNNPRPNKTASEPYAPVFRGHVRLYELAEKYDIDSLRRLSLHRLRRTLMEFTVFDENVPDLICLVEEIYEYTVQGSSARVMISEYVSFFIEHIRDRRDFRDLLKHVNDFAHDLVGQMVQRLD